MTIAAGSPRWIRALVFAVMWLAPAAAQDPSAEGPGRQERKTYTGARLLVVEFETSAEAVREVLPEPLEPGSEPLALVFVADYPETSFGCKYREGALFVLARYGTHEGWHCLAMAVDDRKARFLGRRFLGYPKEFARITLDQGDTEVTGRVESDGEELIRIHATLGDEGKAPDILTGRPHLNFLPLPERGTSGSTLLKLTVQVDVRKCRKAEAEVQLGTSKTISLPKIPIGQIRDAMWIEQDMGGPRSTFERIPIR